MLNTKIADHHLTRHACIYIRQSTPAQVRFNQESTERQYNLANQAKALGWTPEQIRILDGDLGQSGQLTTKRDDFKTLVSDVAMGQVGAIFSLESSRLALASIIGIVRDHQNPGVRRRWLLRPVRLQRQPRPWHERHVRSGRTAHYSRAPPRRQTQQSAER